MFNIYLIFFFFFQAEDGIRDGTVTGVQTCALPICLQPRLKTAAQVTTELDAMRKQKGHPPVVYFVDDNFIGNRKATKDMLPHLLAWQKQHGYPLQFACEATLNIAKQPEIQI